MKRNQVRAAGRQTGSESRPSTSRGEAGAPDASQVRTRGTAGEAGKGDRDRNPGAGRLAPDPAHTTAETVIARLRTDPQFPAENADGGEAAFEFIRNAKSRNARTQAEKDASRQANVERVLTAMREGR